MRDIVLGGSGNLDHLGFLNVHWHRSAHGHQHFASIENAAAAVDSIPKLSDQQQNAIASHYRGRDSLEFHQPSEQVGFGKGYSTINHLHVIYQVTDKSAVYNKPLYMAFIDYEKAFDSVEIPAVLEALRRQGICYREVYKYYSQHP